MAGSDPNITESLERERALRLEAERVSRLKDEFLATLGHELRTPLNAILGWARLLESGRLGAEEVKRGGHTIARNARSLAQLINDLLDLSGVMSGKIRVEPEETDLCEIAEAALETMQTTAEAGGIALHKTIEPEECLVFGDPHRLQQVIWNLLSNAVKFTSPGGSVSLELTRSNGDWQISVVDTGIGMPPQLVPFVFDRFHQADAAFRRGQSGLGLGLAIVKQLVELHGGRVWAESGGENKGSTFRVRLPRLAPREHVTNDGPVVRATAQRLDLQGIRVLVVDDEPDTLDLSRQVLADRGAQVITVPSVDAALDALGTFGPSVLVSDLSMPGRDGYELIRIVRATLDADALPAAALTAFARPEDAVRAQSAGFQMHLAKPVEPDELIRVVAQLAGRA